MILVTGGSGLLGSHLVLQLAAAGMKVRILIHNNESKNKLLQFLVNSGLETNMAEKNLEFIQGDVTDKFSIYAAAEGVQKVYHCAAMVSLHHADRMKMPEVNIRGTANVVNACLQYNVQKLLHVSSIAAINSKPEAKFSIEELGWPSGNELDYGYSKRESEFEVWRGISEGLNAVIINPSIIIGEGSLESGSGKLFKRVYSGMKYYTEGVSGFVDVKDVVRAMILLMDSATSSERYILNGENLSYKEFFEMVAKAFHVKPPKKYAGRSLTELAWRLDKISAILPFRKHNLTRKAARAAHAINYYSSQKILDSFTFKLTPVEETIERTANFFLKEFRK